MVDKDISYLEAARLHPFSGRSYSDITRQSNFPASQRSFIPEFAFSPSTSYRKTVYRQRTKISPVVKPNMDKNALSDLLTYTNGQIPSSSGAGVMLNTNKIDNETNKNIPIPHNMNDLIQVISKILLAYMSSDLDTLPTLVASLTPLLNSFSKSNIDKSITLPEDE
jgi:hypothetical protein